MAQRILVVNADSAAQQALAELLTLAGYHTIAVSTFEEAKYVLNEARPDLLVAQVRLGAFNGLHLVLRGRAESPEMAAIVTMSPSIVRACMK